MSTTPTYNHVAISIPTAAIVITRSGCEHTYLPDVGGQSNGWLIRPDGNVTPANPLEGWKVTPLPDDDPRIIAAKAMLVVGQTRIDARNAKWEADRAAAEAAQAEWKAGTPARAAALDLELCEWITDARLKGRTSETSLHIDPDHWASGSKYTAYIRERRLIAADYDDCSFQEDERHEVQMPNGETVTVVEGSYPYTCGQEDTRAAAYREAMREAYVLGIKNIWIADEGYEQHVHPTRARRRYAALEVGRFQRTRANKMTDEDCEVWIAKMRQAHHDGMLSEYQTTRLEQIPGWTW